MCAREKGNKSCGLLALSLAALIKKELNVDAAPHTIQDYMKKGLVSVLPCRTGPKGCIDDPQYKNLCAAFKIYVSIQSHMRVRNRKKLGKLLQTVVYGDAPEVKD